MGSLVGITIGTIIVREITFQHRHYWNQWALFILPVSAVFGSVFASLKLADDLIDRM